MLEKFRQHFQTSKANFTIYSLLSFVLPVLAVLFVFFLLKINPFGNQSVLSSDFANQYLAYFYYIKENGLLSPDFVYSTSMTLGGNFFGVVAYYLLSPFNLLIYIWPENHLIELMTLLTILKIGTIGSTTYYLLNRWNSVDQPNKNPTWALAFSLIVALSQFIGAYANNIMWLDAIIFMPLIIYGIERILAGKSGVVLSFFVAISMITQYYLTSMTLLFAGIYFILRYFQLKGHHPILNIAKFGKAFVAVVIGLLISSPVWLTGFMQAKEKKDSLIENWGILPYQFDWTKQYQLGDLLSNVTGLKQFNIVDGGTETGKMMLSLGITVTVVFIAIFILSHQKWSIKISWLILPSILIASVLFTKIDLIWMGFTKPLGFPHRYLYLFSFSIAIIGIDLISHGLKFFKFNKQQMTTAGMIVAGIFLVNATIHFNQAHAELISSEKRITIAEFNQYYQAEKAAVDFAKNNQTQNLERMVVSGTYSKNDPAMFDYSGIAHYSSAESLELMNITSGLGYMQRQIWYMWTGDEAGSTLSMDSLLGVGQYLQADKTFFKSVKSGMSPMSSFFDRQYDGLEKIYSNKIDVYQNKYAMPFGIVSTLPSNYKLSGDLDKRIDNLNMVWRNWTGSGNNILIENQVRQLGMLNYQITVGNSGLQYIIFNSDRDYDYSAHGIKAQLYVNGVAVDQDFRSGVIDLGQFQKGQRITVQLQLTGKNAVDEVKRNISIQSFSENIQLLEKVSTELRTRDTQTHINGNKISSNFYLDSDEKQYLILSIPYDQAWKFKNNGKTVEAVKVNENFIGIPLSKGDNDIKGKYQVPYSFISMLLAIIGTVGLLYLIVNKNNPFAIRNYDKN